MNRIEFMETLSRLLLDIPEEDRIDALKYYNDYFDDAGSENEQNVIEELESPEKVAMKIKADREDTGTTEEYDTDTGKGQAERTSDSEYKAQTDTENTYQYYQEDRSGDEKDNKIYQDNGSYEYGERQENKPWTNKWLKMILIVAIILVGCPVIVPAAIGLLAAIAGILIAAFAFFIAIVIGFAAIVIVAIVLTAAGIGSMFVNIGAGLALFGAGMILIAVGAIGTVAGIRLCIIVFPGMIRGIVWILRKPFHRKAMA